MFRQFFISILFAIGVIATVVGPASAAPANLTYDGKDVAWTDNGKHTIAVQDRECDHNDAAVRYRTGTPTVHTLRDRNGCNPHGIAYGPMPVTVTSLHVCEYKGDTNVIAHCTKWKAV